MRLCCVVIFVISICPVNGQGQFYAQNRACSALTIPMCLEMPYNSTRLPNLLQQRTQEEAAIMAHEFLPLVDIKCSPYVRFFICSVFSPMCTEHIPYGIPPCKSVCTSVKEGCLPILKNLNFTWPKFLECDPFPEKGLCMLPPELNHPPIETGVRRPHPRGFLPPVRPSQTTDLDIESPFDPIIRNKPDVFRNPCTGSRIWVQIKQDEGSCLPICHKDFLFTANDKNIAMKWATSWAFVSLLSTGFSLLTFSLNRKRFDYPERPVIYLAMSYFFYSAPFLIRAVMDAASLSCEFDPVSGESHLAASGTSSPGCVATFLLQYYFGVASEIWWTILTFCWFMTACKYWVSEGLQNYVTYFHTIAWGGPAIGVVAAISFKQVNGDELLGMCFVGHSKPWADLYLVILPQGILLGLGTVFIALGFISLFKIRNSFRREFSCTQNVGGSSPSTSLTTLPPSFSPSSITQSSPAIRLAALHVGKLERLMIRLGVFSVLSTLPAIFVLACRLHAHFMVEEWSNDAARASAACETGWNGRRCGPRKSFPPMEVELLKIFMSLIIGVTSGIWVWSHKTVTLWKDFLRKRLLCFSTQTSLRTPLPPSSKATDTTSDHRQSRGFTNLRDSWNPLICGSAPNNYPQQKGNLCRVFPAGSSSGTPVKVRASSEFSTSFV